MKLVKPLPVHPYSIDIFSYSGPSEILGSDGKQKVLTESRIPHKLVLGGMRIVTISVSSHEQTQ